MDNINYVIIGYETEAIKSAAIEESSKLFSELLHKHEALRDLRPIVRCLRCEW